MTKNEPQTRAGANGWRRRAPMVRLLVLALLGAVRFLTQSTDAANETNSKLIRFAFSTQMLREVNENDAKASVKAWAVALARERNVPMSAEPIVLSGTAQLRQALRDATIDGAAVTTEEYFGLEPELQSTNLFLSFIGGQCTEEYVLLVRADSGISDLGGLRGRKLLLFDNTRASLAPSWLEIILLEKNLSPAAGHFAQVLKARKLVQVVLPVFFRQQDACLVTRRGFDTMCELNPQVRAQLRVLATSPQFVPAVGFIRSGYNSRSRELLMTAFRGMETSPSGSQVLTLFQSDQLREAPTTLLDSARELLAAHKRLKMVTANASAPAKGPDHPREAETAKPRIPANAANALPGGGTSHALEGVNP